MATAAAFYDHNPYPGPRSFSRKERAVFRGRDYESRELFSLVVAHKIVLLYSQSGAGKSSLLNAGLTPLMQEEGFQVFPVARVAGGIPASLDIETVPNPYALNVLLSWSEQNGGLEPNQLATVSLNQFLKGIRSSHGEDRSDSVRVLIFDQFEELFTFYPERWKERAEFIDQLAEALGADDYLRVVLGMREEYLGPLGVYAHALPEALETRFRLERLGKDDALAAVVEPLKTTRRRFAPDVAEKLVEDLLKIKVVADRETTLEAVGEYAEPVQLQVVCSGLWDKLPAETQEITFEYLQDFGDVTDALSGFYEESLKEAAQKTSLTEGRLRKWFGQTLITPAGTRGTVFRGTAETGGLPNAAVDILQAKHIIRCDSRAGSAWYELTHDRFIDPILKSNARWREKHGDLEKLRVRFEAKAEHWDQTGRPVEELLKETELREARLWLENPDAVDLGCSEGVHAWISASAAEVQQRQERQHYLEAQAQIAKRLRVVAASLFVALVFALGAGWFAWKKMKEANQQRTVAEQQRSAATKSAEATRIQALREREANLDVVATDISLLDSLIEKSSPREAAEWHAQKAGLLIKQGKLEDAVEEANKAIDVAADFRDARTERGYALMLQNHPQEALSDFEYIREHIDKKDTLNYLNLTIAYSQLGRVEDASGSLDQAIFYSLHGQNSGGAEEMVPTEITDATGRDSLYANGEVFRQALYFLRPLLDACSGQGSISADLEAAEGQASQDGIRPMEKEDAALIALTWAWFLERMNRPDYGLSAGQGILWEEAHYPSYAQRHFAAFLKTHQDRGETRYNDLAKWVRDRHQNNGPVPVEFSFAKVDPTYLEAQSSFFRAQGKYSEAEEFATQAIAREPHNVRLYFNRMGILNDMADEAGKRANKAQTQADGLQKEIQKIDTNVSSVQAATPTDGLLANRVTQSPEDREKAKQTRERENQERVRKLTMERSSEQEAADRARQEERRLYQKMIDDCNQVLNVRNVPEAYFERAEANNSLKKPRDVVIRDLKRTVELAPAHASAIAWLGYLTADTSAEHPEKAAEWAKKYDNFFPGTDPELLGKLADLQIKMKQFSNAYDTIQKAIALDPTKDSYYDTLSDAERGLGYSEVQIQRNRAEGDRVASDYLRRRGKPEDLSSAELLEQDRWDLLSKLKDKPSAKEVRCNPAVTTCVTLEVTQDYGEWAYMEITSLPLANPDSGIVKIDRGENDGVVLGSTGDVYARPSDDNNHQRQAAQIGTAEVLSVEPQFALVRVKMSNPKGDGMIRIGDAIQLKVRTPHLERRSGLWRVVDDNIALADLRGEEIVNFRMLYNDESPELDRQIYRKLLDDILETGKVHGDQMDEGKAISIGRFAGHPRRLRQILEETSREDLDRFFLYVGKNLPTYFGHVWKIGLIYAVWVKMGMPEN